MAPGAENPTPNLWDCGDNGVPQTLVGSIGLNNDEKVFLSTPPLLQESRRFKRTANVRACVQAKWPGHKKACHPVWMAGLCRFVWGASNF